MMRSKAFTLIELLAAIALFALMVIGVTSALEQIARTSVKLGVRTESVSSGQVALDRLKRDIRMAYSENIQRAQTYFGLKEGSTGPELTFSYLDSPIRTIFTNRTSGVKFASYALEKGKNGTFDLIRSEIPMYDMKLFSEGSKTLADYPAQTLARGVLNWEVELYDYRNDQWIKEWNSDGRITGGYYPLAVRFTLEVVDPEVEDEKRAEKSLTYKSAVMVLNEYLLRK